MHFLENQDWYIRTRLKDKEEAKFHLISLQQDYPIFGSVPDTNFNCQGKVHGGYYSDIEAGCQVRTKRSPNTTEYEIRFFTSASKRLTDSAPTASSARMAPSLSRLGTL